MSQDIISLFIEELCAHDCAPANNSDIVADCEDHTIRLAKDKKGLRLAYCLTILPDGFAYGNYVNFDINYKGRWHSKKSVTSLTKEEKAAIQDRIKAHTDEQDELRAKRHAVAANEAKKLWDSLKTAPADHPYLTRKGIKPHGARIDGHDLIYQAISDGKIWTYQRISPTGDKLFLTGGRKSGSYFPFTTGSEPKDTIIIAEGVATAASLREATNLPVLAAYDAGNLQSVAQEMRRKYKQSRILLAGDNDKYGAKNTGHIAAQQAALKINGFVVIPEFDTEEGQPSDWNDYHAIYGLEQVRDKILAVLHTPAKEVVEVRGSPESDSQPDFHHDSIPVMHPDNFIPFNVPVETGAVSPPFDDKKISNQLLWKKWPSDMDNGKLEPNSLSNILVFMRHKDKYNGLFRYDRFARRVLLYKEPFWPINEVFKIRELRDMDTSYVCESMERDGLSPTSAKIREAIEVCAHESWINPPLDYFESLKWDRVPRLCSWLTIFLGADGDLSYLSAVGTAFLIAGVARIYKPGSKAENMMVLEGPQGLKKSTALKTLANVGRGEDEESYFCDTLSFAQIEDKDSVLKLQGKLIVEFPDLAGLSSREVESVKAWMSVTEDEIRVPYGREMMKFPRQFILAGSTNESHWLKDGTGNRRFWPVQCGEIDILGLKEVREQLWAEAVHLFKHQAIWWIGRDSNVWKAAEIEQGSRMLEDVWQVHIEKFVRGINFITVKEVLENLNISPKDQTRQHQTQVIKNLKALGFVSKKQRNGGEPVSGWGRIEKVPEKVVEPQQEIMEIAF